MALAMPLAVRDEAERELVAEAVASLWPQGPLQVVVELQGDGLQLAQGVLIWRRDGVVARAVPGVDASTAVVLARSWLASDSGLGGQVPEIPFEVEELEERVPRPPEPRVRVKPAPQRPQLWVGVGADKSLGGTGCDGLRSGAAWFTPRMELDLSFAFALPGPSIVSAADLRREETLMVARPASVGGSVVWDFGLPRAVTGQVTVAPLLELGAEVGPAQRREVSLGPEPSVALEPIELGASVAGALGLELWMSSAAGVRATLRMRPDALDIDMWGSFSLWVAGRSKDRASP